MKPVKESKESEIRRKLAQSSINSPQEYEEIISKLINQREKLETDLKMLRDKVVGLQQKQAQRLAKTLKKRVTPMKINLRDELNKKYEQLRQWQKKSLKAARHPTIELQYKAYFDRLFSVQQQIQQTLQQLNDQLATNKHLNKAYRAISRQESANNHAQQNMEHQNQLLKKRIFSLRKIVDRQLTKEVELQNYLIGAQEKHRERERQSRQRISRERQRQRQVLSRQKREREEKERQQRQYKLRHQQERRMYKTNFSEHSSIKSSDSDIVDFEVHPEQISSRQEVYQIQGRLNRIQKKFRTATAQIQGRFKRDYPNQALRQKRQGSKLSFGKQFDILLDRVKTNINRLNQLNKQKINLFLVAVDRHEKHQSSEDRSERSSDSSLLHALKPIDTFKRTVKAHTETKSRSPPNKVSRVKSNASSTSNFKEKIMYAKVHTISVDETTQTDRIDQFYQLPLRRDYIGCMDQHCTFDRNILEKAASSIKTLQIYYTDRGIASMRAIYTLHASDETTEGPLILPDHFIRNYCKVHVIDTSHDDFIRYFKLRHHTEEDRITSVKIVTNRGVKNGWGDSKIKEEKAEIDEQMEKEMVLDINEDEYPTAIFCSHVQRGPYWYLTGFGVQIDRL